MNLTYKTDILDTRVRAGEIAKFLAYHQENHPEEIFQFIPILREYAKGKSVELNIGTRWSKEEGWYFNDRVTNYRVTPTWPKALHVGCWLRKKSTANYDRWMITKIDHDKLTTCDRGALGRTLGELQDHEWSSDCRCWFPFTV